MPNKINKNSDILARLLKENGNFPNHPEYPLLIYQHAFLLEGDDPASFIERHLKKNRWENLWRNGVLDHHHFHSNTHEVLAIYRGKALIIFGGPKGSEQAVKEGDVVILPAGTAHKLLQSENNFACIGGYPFGKLYDMHKGEENKPEQIKRNIKEVRMPAYDPVYGEDGPLFEYWK